MALLEDLHEIFSRRRTDRLATANIIDELLKLEARPWLHGARAGDHDGDGGADLGIGVPAEAPAGSVHVVAGLQTRPGIVDLGGDPVVFRYRGASGRISDVQSPTLEARGRKDRSHRRRLGA